MTSGLRPTSKLSKSSAQTNMDGLKEFLTRISDFKLPLILSLVGIVLVFGGLLSSSLPFSKVAAIPKESLITNSQPVSNLKVDVAGAVANPGVYSLNSNSRIEDAIKAAGGFNSEVNTVYISKSLNLSQKVSDGQKIYIPFQNETTPQISLTTSTSQNSSSLIGINSGTLSELESLPGIGPATGQKIINNRPYSGIEDLISKKVVSKSVYDKIKDLVDLH